MRGGVSYSEAHMMSPTEREIVASIIKDNLETTKETKLSDDTRGGREFVLSSVLLSLSV